MRILGPIVLPPGFICPRAIAQREAVFVKLVNRLDPPGAT
jgi:hypothetical protein